MGGQVTFWETHLWGSDPEKRNIQYNPISCEEECEICQRTVSSGRSQFIIHSGESDNLWNYHMPNLFSPRWSTFVPTQWTSAQSQDLCRSKFMVWHMNFFLQICTYIFIFDKREGNAMGRANDQMVPSVFFLYLSKWQDVFSSPLARSSTSLHVQHQTTFNSAPYLNGKSIIHPLFLKAGAALAWRGQRTRHKCRNYYLWSLSNQGLPFVRPSGRGYRGARQLS